jgi:indole-3-glycerol phosphate synthase
MKPRVYRGLDEIVRYKRIELKRRVSPAKLSEYKSKIKDLPWPLDFKGALLRPCEGLRLIGEVRREGEGELVRSIQEKTIAICACVDRFYLGGELSLLEGIKGVTHLPLVAREFILQEFQVYELRAHMADAVLFITSLLEPNQMRDYFALASELGLTPLAEISLERELDRVIDFAGVIAVTDPRLIPLLEEVPRPRIFVSDVEVESKSEVQDLIYAGIEALIVDGYRVEEFSC